MLKKWLNKLFSLFKKNESKTISENVERPFHSVALESKPEHIHAPEKQKEIILPKYRNKLQFRKQQLIGKVLTFGKNRIRIHKDAETVYNKFNYYIEKI